MRYVHGGRNETRYSKLTHKRLILLARNRVFSGSCRRAFCYHNYMIKHEKRSVLFVCTGNICRSPTAEGVFRKLVASAGLDGHIESESAGTHSYHVGYPPDSRTQEAARARGYDLSRLRARRVSEADFRRFDLIVAMDRTHHEILTEMAPAGTAHKVHMMMDFARQARHRDVPDPYYGGPEGFELVLDLLEDAADGLLGALRADFDAVRR
jgi:protein-tyrosine phosphatase